ncbi:hypothetical protein Ssi03_70300 [Sphaerisporangium siamense]|uniref:Secreted protein n=1 Tax=Sphaerisporangium siamense TaxID=795645 RepID=A0A7W7D2L7_9ACTN|nr:hypothetical protein [Sphaerisporangium siamense]MBB4698854.1 hypothetical protein [Sphaerisporangium siamense]GII89040.1 hypothetical protein Ssi03_70300 [Sphaerisporangium siamense]
MITTKACTQIAAGALATAAVLAPTAAQAAGPSPYAQAAAAVKVDGTLDHGKNIVSVSRASAGRYCVRVGSDIDLSKEVVHITLWNSLGTTHGAYLPHPLCGSQPNTILVAFNTAAGAAADAAFYLSIP